MASMKSIIMYHSPEPLTPQHYPVFIDDKVVSYVRAEYVDAEDLSDALDAGQPTGNEVVLNTVRPIQ
jgi:hypothetical protein